ncbi:uncharacterized protein ARMOST_06217 [Armillaria ostoyae]|uniref:Uncharacterized protein n=1 Tax=Armillaria ostoyae TaxID=47428 RepID=A0A284R2F9_ARMOS|nr:uncharacterized protein ARMOST_06217 [Armillaria ostoyae]
MLQINNESTDGLTKFGQGDDKNQVYIPTFSDSTNITFRNSSQTLSMKYEQVSDMVHENDTVTVVAGNAETGVQSPNGTNLSDVRLCSAINNTQY